MSMRKYSWLLVPIISIGGLLFPLIGLLMVPIMAAIIIMAVFKGRFWCGNICPRGSFLDRIVIRYSRKRKIPEIFRNNNFRMLAVILFFGLFFARIFGAFSGSEGIGLLINIGLIFASVCFITSAIAAVLGILYSPRAWCNFCPMGSVQKALHSMDVRSDFLKDENVSVDKSACISCGLCSKVCPMGTNPSTGEADPDCIKCSSCVYRCPAKALKIN